MGRYFRGEIEKIVSGALYWEYSLLLLGESVNVGETVNLAGVASHGVKCLEDGVTNLLVLRQRFPSRKQLVQLGADWWDGIKLVSAHIIR